MQGYTLAKPELQQFMSSVRAMDQPELEPECTDKETPCCSPVTACSSQLGGVQPRKTKQHTIGRRNGRLFPPTKNYGLESGINPSNESIRHLGSQSR